MDKMTNEELVALFSERLQNNDIQKAIKIETELLSRLARVQELEAQLRQETARLNAADKEIEQLREQVDFERNKTSSYTWKKGQRAIQALEKIEKLESDQLWKDGYYVEFYNNILCVLADWRGND